MKNYEPVNEDETLSEGQMQGGLRFLSLKQVLMLDKALQSLGDYGELHLIVDKGRLRFVVIQKSIDANKWEKDF